MFVSKWQSQIASQTPVPYRGFPIASLFCSGVCRRTFSTPPNILAKRLALGQTENLIEPCVDIRWLLFGNIGKTLIFKVLLKTIYGITIKIYLLYIVESAIIKKSKQIDK